MTVAIAHLPQNFGVGKKTGATGVYSTKKKRRNSRDDLFSSIHGYGRRGDNPTYNLPNEVTKNLLDQPSNCG
jgi:hypothetical protein